LIEILDTYFRDNQNAWQLQADGSYRRLEPEETQSRFRAQKVLFQGALQAVQQAEQARRNTFQPHEAAKNK
jgi:polyphosphate kinase